MRYQYVTDDELNQLSQDIISRGIPEAQRESTLKQAADLMDYSRSRDSGTPLFLKAMGTAIPQFASDFLRGAPAFVPGEGPIDRLLRRGSEKVGEYVPSGWSKEVGEAQTGPLWGEGAGRMWSSSLGYSLPLAGGAMALNAIGGIPGKALGGIVGGKMGGPPGAITGMAVGKKIGGLGLSWAGLSGIEAGSIIREMEEKGIPRPIAEKWGAVYGGASGFVEALMFDTMGRAFGGAAKLGPIKTLLEKVAVPKGLATAGALAALPLGEGGEEVTQEMLRRKVLQAAADEAGVEVELGEPAYLKSFAVGAGLGATVGGVGMATHAAVSPVVSLYKTSRNINKLAKQQAVDAHEALKKGEMPDIPTPESTITGEPVGATEHKEAVRAGHSAEDMATFVDTYANDTELRNIATNMEIPVVYPDGKPKHYAQLRAEVLAKIPDIESVREGWQMEDDEPSFRGISMDPVQPGDSEIRQVKAVDKIFPSVLFNFLQAEATRKKSKSGKTPLTAEEVVSIQEVALFTLSTIRQRVLAQIKGPQIASAIIKKIEGEIQRKDQFAEALSKELTLKEYATYLDAMQGESINTMKVRAGRLAGGSAASEISFKVNMSMQPTQLKTRDGNVVKVADTPKSIPWLWTHKLRAKFPMLYKLASATNVRFLEVDFALMERVHALQRSQRELHALEQQIWKQVPRKMRRGKGRRLFNQLIAYSMVSPTERTELQEQFGVTNLGELIDNYVKEMGLNAVEKEAIPTVLAQVVGDYQEMYRWFVRNGIVPPDQFRAQYLPLIRGYMTDKSTKSQIGTFESWLMDQGFSIDDPFAQKAISIFDTISDLKIKGIPTPGNATPFMQIARSENDAFNSAMARITDVQELTDLYIRRALNKMYFGDIAPAVYGFMEETVKKYEAQRNMGDKSVDPKALKEMLGDYLESIMGVPETTTSAMQNVDLMSTTHTMGKFLTWATKSWNNSKLGRIAELPSELSLKEVIDTGLLNLYALTLGVPHNFVAPLKNILTQNMFAALVGPKSYLEGLIRLKDPALLKKLGKFDLRTEFTPISVDRTAIKGHLARASTWLLELFRWSDKINVYSAASAALVSMEKARKAWDESDGTLKLHEFSAALLDGNKKVDVDDAEVMKKGILKNPIWKAPIFKGITQELYERIQQGKFDEAEKMWAQYMVNLTQWRYGKGGSPAFLRNGLAKALFMYVTWPLNYTELFASTVNPSNRVASRMIGIMLSEVLLLSALTLLPVAKLKRAPEWTLLGPFPQEIGMTGPFADWLNGILKYVFGNYHAAIEQWTLPEEKRFHTRSLQEEMGDSFLPYVGKDD